MGRSLSLIASLVFIHAAAAHHAGTLEPVAKISGSQCVDKVVKLSALPGHVFPDATDGGTVYAYFEGCAIAPIEGERTASTVHVRIPEGALNGCVWVGRGPSEAEVRTHEELTRRWIADARRREEGLATMKASGIKVPALGSPPAAESLPPPPWCAARPCAEGAAQISIERTPELIRFEFKEGSPTYGPPGFRSPTVQSIPGCVPGTLEWETTDAGVSIRKAGGAELAKGGRSGAVTVIPSNGFYSLKATNSCGVLQRNLQVRSSSSLQFATTEIELAPGEWRAVDFQLSCPQPADTVIAFDSTSPEVTVTQSALVKGGVITGKVYVSLDAGYASPTTGPVALVSGAAPHVSTEVPLEVSSKADDPICVELPKKGSSPPVVVAPTPTRGVYVRIPAMPISDSAG